MKLPRLLDRDLKIVERKKRWFLVPLAFVVTAIVMGLIWGLTPGPRHAVNVSIDFTGGHALTLRLGHRMATDSDYERFTNEILRIADELSDDLEVQYPDLARRLVIDEHETMRQGVGEDASIRVRYRGLRSPDYRTDDIFMEYVNERFTERLMTLFAHIPVVTTSGSNLVATFPERLPDGFFVENGTEFNAINFDEIVANAANAESPVTINSMTVSYIHSYEYIRMNRRDVRVDRYQTVVTVAILEAVNDTAVATITYALTIPDYFSGRPEDAGMTSATIGTELLVSAILAVSLALVLMLIYIAFRFDLSSGAAAVLGLIHDLIIMVSVMVIFNIEIGVTFIAALITILGYSLNNTIILFDRVRDKQRAFGNKEFNVNKVANDAARDTIFRSFATTITGLFPMVALGILGAIGGLASIWVFAIPIIVGLLAGAYSTIFVLPSVWSIVKNGWFRRQKKKGRLPSNPATKEPAADAS